MSEPGRPGLDPDRAAEQARRRREGEDPRSGLPKQPIDTRRYQRMIGGFGLLLVVIFSVYILTAGNHSASPGITAGRQIHRFVAPLASSNLNVAANLHPRCDPSRPARRGLNVCGRHALVLGFFVTGAAPCVSAVDALQSVSRRFPQVQFAAVAVNATRSATARLVRRHRWTIPVAYDLTGSVGQAYGVEVCPIIELVRPGGIVQQRLIGYPWRSPAALAPRVARLAATL